MDAFTRFVELFPTKGVTAHEAATALFPIFGRYDAPKALRTDNGSQFAAQIIEDLLRLVGTDHQYTIAYRPQSNGLIERTNGEVVRHIRAIVTDRRVVASWSSVLPLVQRIVNASPHTSLGTTPARLMYGGNVNLSRHLLGTAQGPDPIRNVEEYVQELCEAQSSAIAASLSHQDDIVRKRLLRL
eukprot:ANDGO_04689.mRNA.1 Pol polyprotein